MTQGDVYEIALAATILAVGVVVPTPAPHLRAQVRFIRLDRVPQLGIRALHIGSGGVVELTVIVVRCYRSGKLAV